MESLRAKQGYICDMDGVIYHGNMLLPGVKQFIDWLEENHKNYLFLTNSSERSPRELQQKLQRMGLNVIGEPGLISALYDAGFTMNDVNPDYVVVGETANYNYDKILKAVQLVLKGAKLIGTNPDLTGPVESGIAPATRALISPIEMATGKRAYFIGKPNPLMMRTAQKRLGIHSADTVIVGDRMDTDIVAGIEAQMETVLVLSGVTTREAISLYPYRPSYVLDGVGDIPG
jgi:NagD protein